MSEHSPPADKSFRVAANAVWFSMSWLHFEGNKPIKPKIVRLILVKYWLSMHHSMSNMLYLSTLNNIVQVNRRSAVLFFPGPVSVTVGCCSFGTKAKQTTGRRVPPAAGRLFCRAFFSKLPALWIYQQPIFPQRVHELYAVGIWSARTHVRPKEQSQPEHRTNAIVAFSPHADLGNFLFYYPRLLVIGFCPGCKLFTDL